MRGNNVTLNDTFVQTIEQNKFRFFAQKTKYEKN